MALPSSGAISLSDVNVELGLSSTAQISLDDSAVRTLFQISSGAIDMDSGHGKSNQFSFTISSNTTNANLATLATAAGWNGSSNLLATIDSGVYIYSTSTGTPALTVSGSVPGGVSLVNNGLIVGRGGNGGNGANASTSAIAGSAGGAGGVALSVSSAITITNNGTIGGGGGGGGGGGNYANYSCEASAWSTSHGGGGGGGRVNASGGAAGAYGNIGYVYGSGGTASLTAAGSASSILNSTMHNTLQNRGGAGGNLGASGTAGSAPIIGQRRGAGGAGGSAGAAVSGNSNITWVATGTRLGSIA